MVSGETKQQILSAAEEVIYRKGMQESTISEIARRARVTESVIYHHFKNKEDLLFSFVGIHMEEVLAKLEEQLEGIPEPTSRLSKMIWFHLRYNETHREYSRILLFECRSNRNFYLHDAYGLIRRYAEVMLSILRDGVERGVFRKDIDIRLVRDLILGGLDWETLGALAAPPPAHASAEIQEIMDLVCMMIESRHFQSKMDMDKPTRIVIAAEKLFSERGYRQASISEIARLSDVAEGTVYEYFKNKEDLLFSIPKMRFKEHIESLDEVFQIKTPLRKLRRFIRYHFYLYMAKPEFLKTFLLDIQFNPRFYENEALTFLQEYATYVDEIIEEGKKDGSINPSVNDRFFKNLFFGGFCHVALRWVILNEETKVDKMAEIRQLVDLLSGTLSNRNQ